MKTRTIIAGIIVIILLAGGYWYAKRMERAESAPVAGAPTALEQTGADFADPGRYAEGNLLLGRDGGRLIGYSGMALYTYDKDSATSSACTGSCAEAWPPYTVASSSALSNIQYGITGAVGSITRPDGSIQVTYDGKPLYFWAKDADPDTAAGDGIDGFQSAKL